MKSYQEARNARLPLAKALFLLGISMKWIADAVGVTVTTLMKDLKSVGLKRSGEKQETKKVYGNVFIRYAQIFGQITPSSEDALIFQHLINWLRINEVMNVILGLDLAMGRLQIPEYPPELGNHALLVKMLCGGVWPGEIFIGNSRTNFWREYLLGVQDGTIEAPTSHNDLLIDLMKRYVRLYRGNIMPIWPADVGERIDTMLGTLTPREEKVVRLRFGIGAKQHTIEEVGQDFEVTRERIRQIEAKALRRLRHPSRMKYIIGLAEPLRPNYYVPDVSVGVGATASGEAAVEIMMSIEDLVKSVDELEFSVRTANCLFNSDIRRVWELAEKTEEELLRSKNFGRKSLKEVKVVLAEMGLTLGMKFSEDTKKAMLEFAFKSKEGLV